MINESNMTREELDLKYYLNEKLEYFQNQRIRNQEVSVKLDVETILLPPMPVDKKFKSLDLSVRVLFQTVSLYICDVLQKNLNSYYLNSVEKCQVKLIETGQSNDFYQIEVLCSVLKICQPDDPLAIPKMASRQE